MKHNFHIVIPKFACNEHTCCQKLIDCEENKVMVKQNDKDFTIDFPQKLAFELLSHGSSFLEWLHIAALFTYIYLFINTDFAFVLVALYFTFSLLWFNWQNKMILFSFRYNVKYFIINQPTRRVVQTHLYAIFNPLGVFFFLSATKTKLITSHLSLIKLFHVCCLCYTSQQFGEQHFANLISLETDCFLHPFAANPHQPTSSSAEH